MKIKVCGLRDPVNIHDVAGLGPDLLGFNFYSVSPRYCGEVLKPADLSGLPFSPGKAGIFVNTFIDDIVAIFRRYNLDYVQLHGGETAAFCEQISLSGIPVIKAFHVDEQFDFRQLKPYIPFTRSFLFDTPTVNYGGSGKRFNWELLKRYDLGHPFFLSGGIGPGDAEDLLAFNHPALAGVDVNSRFESEPGLKDPEILGAFIRKIKSY